MRKFLFATAGSLGLSLLVATAASAAPLGPLHNDLGAAPVAQDVAWRNICHSKSVVRLNRWGHPYRTTIRDCGRVWVGKPYRGPHYSYYPGQPRPYHRGPDHDYPLYR